MRKPGSIVGTKPRASSRHAGGGLTDKNGYSAAINIAASLDFVAALPNTHYFEYCVEQGRCGKR
jgi:hypothetical protein